MTTDKINIPVELSLDPTISKIITELKARLERDLGNVAQQILQKQFPISQPGVTASQEFEIGGRKYRATASAKMKSPPESVISETGDLDLASLIGFSASIKEIKERINNSLTEDQKKLRAFKDSIKFQPLNVKQQEIQKYIAEHGDINNELTSRLDKITQIISRKDFDKLRQSIAKLTPEEGIKAYSDYINSNGALADRAVIERRKLIEVFKKNTIANQKIRFRSLQDRLSGLSVEDKIREYEQTLNLDNVGGEFKKLITREVNKLRDQLKGIKFKDVKTESVGRPFEEQQKLFQDYIDSGGAFSREAQKEIRKIQLASRKSRLRDFKTEVLTKPIEMREALWVEFANNNADLAGLANIEISKIRDKLKGLKYKDTKLDALNAPLENREKIFQDYIDSGGAFVKQANIEISKIRNKLSRQSFKEARTSISLEPLESQEGLWNAFKASHAEFTKEIDIQINKVKQKLSRRSLRDAKFSISSKPIEEQEKLWEDFKLSNTEFTTIIDNEINKVRAKLRSKRFNTARLDILSKPIEDQERLWNDFLVTNMDLSEKVNKEIMKVRDKAKSLRFKDVKSLALASPLEDQEEIFQDYIRRGGEFVREANNEIRKIRSKLASTRFRSTKAYAATLPLEDQERVFVDWITSFSEFNEEARNEIAKIRRRLRRKTFRTSKSTISDAPIEEQERLWNDFRAMHMEFADEVDAEIRKVRRKLNASRFKNFKISLSGMTIEDQITAWRNFAAANVEFAEIANREIRKLSKRWVDGTKALNRNRFISWTKHLQTLDPSQALVELDRYINAPLSKFVDDARILRERIRRNMNSMRERQERERQRQFSNNTLVAAGAGLGLLGPAGFPLLNIGFAAMSGGLPAALIVGFSVAVGESARALDNFTQKNIDAAKEIALVPKFFKEIENRTKGLDAVLGLPALGARATSMERQFELFKENAANWANAGSVWENLKGSAKALFSDALNNPREFFNPFSFDPRDALLLRAGREFSAQRNTTQDRLEKDIETAYRSFVSNLAKVTVGVETDPYQTWVRMQQASFDPTKTEEMRLQQELVKEVKEIIRIIKEARSPQNQTQNSGWNLPILFTGGI